MHAKHAISAATLSHHLKVLTDLGLTHISEGRAERLLPHRAGEICRLPEVPGRHTGRNASDREVPILRHFLRRYRESAGRLESTRHHRVSSGVEIGGPAYLGPFFGFCSAGFRGVLGGFDGAGHRAAGEAVVFRRVWTMSRMILAARAGSPGHLSTVDSRKAIHCTDGLVIIFTGLYLAHGRASPVGARKAPGSMIMTLTPKGFTFSIAEDLGKAPQRGPLLRSDRRPFQACRRRVHQMDESWMKMP